MGLSENRKQYIKDMSVYLSYQYDSEDDCALISCGYMSDACKPFKYKHIFDENSVCTRCGLKRSPSENSTDQYKKEYIEYYRKRNT